MFYKGYSKKILVIVIIALLSVIYIPRLFQGKNENKRSTIAEQKSSNIIDNIKLDNKDEQTTAQKNTNITASGIIRDGRELIGPLAKIFKDPKLSIKYLNTASSLWEENLTKSLTRFYQQGTVKITKIRSLIQVESKETGRFVEYVQVEIKNNLGNVGGFLALVDSSNGKVIDSWSHGKFAHYEK